MIQKKYIFSKKHLIILKEYYKYITSDDESREALSYLEGIWPNRLAAVAANGNINHVDKMTATSNRINM